MPPKLGILAGGGRLPGQIIQVCRDEGRDFFIIAFEGQADDDAYADLPHAWVRLGAAGQSIERLREAGCKELVMAGSIRRPSFATLRPDKWATLFIAKYGALNLVGDDSLLKTLIKALEEEEGFRVIGVETLLPDLLAPKGALGQVEPDWQAEDDIQCALEAALDIGRRDIGQGAVAQLGRVLAVEDKQGTDALLKQAKKMRLEGPGGVLVKTKKPGQETRADLPTIGRATVEAAFDAGLRGIAVEAGAAIIVDREAVIEAADEAGLFVIGIDAGNTGKHPAEAGTEQRPLIFLVAGEPSGDILGARLMASLKKKTKNEISFSGIGGNRMEEQGLKSMFPMDELSVMGIAEVLPKIPNLLGRINETAAAIARLRPACVVTIDSPDFNFRVAKRLKGIKKNKSIPIVHYVAPTVWAWRPGRAKKVSRILDHLLTLLPFEPPYFEKEGLATTFVGHPVVESGADKGRGNEFRKRHGISPDEEIICVLPGSRMSEVSRLQRVFGETLFMLKKKHPNLHAVVPAAGPVAIAVRRLTGEWPVPTLIVDNDKEKFDAFDASNVALAASGTVALELAMAGTPTVIAYKTNLLTALIAKVLVKAPFANIINLILERESIPEFLQSACRAEFLSAALEDLLMDEDRRKRQISAYDNALKQLTPKGPPPADQAAKAVLDVISKSRKEKGLT